MKQKKFNAITHGASGKFGDQCIYRIRNGKTIICKPQPPRPGPGTPAQQKARQTMKDANDYARRMKLEPAIRQLYLSAANGDMNENSLAVRDFFRAPVINEINLCTYSGGPDSYLTIFAKDDFMVSQVTVHIYDTFNHLIETGIAVMVNKDEFRYHAAAQCMDRSGCRVEVAVSDLPGNVTVQAIDIPGEMLVVPVEVVGLKEDDEAMLTPEHVRSEANDEAMLTPEHVPSLMMNLKEETMLTPEHVPDEQHPHKQAMLTPEHVPPGNKSILTPKHILSINMNLQKETMYTPKNQQQTNNEATSAPTEEDLLIASLKLTALFEEDTATEAPVSSPAPVLLLFQQPQPVRTVVHHHIIPAAAPATGIDLGAGLVIR